MLVQLKKEERGEGRKLLKAVSTRESMSIYIFNKESKEQDKEIIPKVSVYKEKEWCKGNIISFTVVYSCISRRMFDTGLSIDKWK